MDRSTFSHGPKVRHTADNSAVRRSALGARHRAAQSICSLLPLPDLEALVRSWGWVYRPRGGRTVQRIDTAGRPPIDIVGRVAGVRCLGSMTGLPQGTIRLFDNCYIVLLRGG